jgi:hypothetical protein
VKVAHNTVIMTFFHFPNTLSNHFVRALSTPEFSANLWANVVKPARVLVTDPSGAVLSGDESTAFCSEYHTHPTLFTQ